MAGRMRSALISLRSRARNFVPWKVAPPSRTDFGSFHEENRHDPLEYRRLAALTLFAALALSAWAHVDRAAAATPPAKSLPPDIAKLFDQFQGDWNASDLRLEAGGQVMKGTSKVHCAKTESGMAVQCRLLVSAPGMQIDDTNLIGWNGETGEVHLFCAGAAAPRTTTKGASTARR